VLKAQEDTGREGEVSRKTGMEDISVPWPYSRLF